MRRALKRRMPNIRERAVDELHLAWVALRAQGMTSAEIGKLYNATPEAVRIATNRIRNADNDEAAFWGDDPATIPQHYWDAAAMSARGAPNIVAFRGKGRVSK